MDMTKTFEPREIEYNSDNEINEETFLFGGYFGNVYNKRHSDGWFCLDGYRMESEYIKSIEDFTETIRSCLSGYVWDTDSCITREIKEANKACQKFQMPCDELIEVWYENFLAEKTENEKEEE